MKNQTIRRMRPAFACGLALGLTLALVASRVPAADPAAFDAAVAEIDSASAAFTAAAGVLGSRADAAITSLAKAKSDVEDAAQKNAGGDRRRASAALRRAVRKVVGVGFKLRSLRARKTIPDDTRLPLLDRVRSLESDLKTLRKNL